MNQQITCMFNYVPIIALHFYQGPYNFTLLLLDFDFDKTEHC